MLKENTLIIVVDCDSYKCRISQIPTKLWLFKRNRLVKSLNYSKVNGTL